MGIKEIEMEIGTTRLDFLWETRLLVVASFGLSKETFQTSTVTWKRNRKVHLPILPTSNYFREVNIYESKFKLHEALACTPHTLYPCFPICCLLSLSAMHFCWAVVCNVHIHAHMDANTHLFLQIIVNCLMSWYKYGGVDLQSPHSEGWDRRIITQSRTSCAAQ